MTMASKKTPAAKPAKKAEIRLKKTRNPNPPPPPKEYQFKPGQSGNPGGRPKLLSDAYRKKLAEIYADGRSYAEMLADAIITEVLKGDVSAAREVRSATEGERIQIDTWETRIVQAIKAGEVDYGSVVEEFGSALAVELYRKANVEITTDGGIITKTE
jgi:hypothetical protein